VLDPFGEADAPNFVAFSALFDHLHHFHKQYGHTIDCFVHDEQDQFIPHFKEAFPLLAKFHGRRNRPRCNDGLKATRFSHEAAVTTRLMSTHIGRQNRTSAWHLFGSRGPFETVSGKAGLHNAEGDGDAA
jgi:hypothetical protein